MARVRRMSPIGLDLGSSAFKAVQIRTRKGEWRISHASMSPAVDIFDPDMAADRIGQVIDALVQTGGFTGKQVIVAAPGHGYVLRVLNLPEMPAEELDEACRWELAQHTPFSIEDAVVRWNQVSDTEDGEQQQIVAVAANKNTIIPMIDAVRASGLRCIAVDIMGAAACRAILTESECEQPTVICDIGDSATSIDIVDDGCVKLHRSISVGMNSIHNRSDYERTLQEARELARQGFEVDVSKEIPVDETAIKDIGGEISRSLGYYRMNFRREPEQVILHGGGACIADIADMIGSVVGLEAKSADIVGSGGLSRRLRVGLTRREFGCRFTVATGLALKGVVS